MELLRILKKYKNLFKSFDFDYFTNLFTFVLFILNFVKIFEESNELICLILMLCVFMIEQSCQIFVIF